MDNFLDISNNTDLLVRTSIWVREKYKIPSGQIIQNEFQEEFGCKIHWINAGYVTQINKLEFNSEHDKLIFALRWL